MSNLNHTKILAEEIANSLTHAVGLALSIGGLAVLVVFATASGTVWHIVSCSIYGSTLVFLYLASTLYHSFRNPRLRRILSIIDDASIYLLIAGTYTPFTLVTLRGGWGWTLFSLIWGLALIGILLEVFTGGERRILSSCLYLMMGWLIIIAMKPLFASLPTAGMTWLIGGGLLYTVGILFYWLERIPFFHTIWHLFVLGGSICHFFSVLFYVLPPA